MANCRKPIIPTWLIPGLLAGLVILVITLSALIALWVFTPSKNVAQLLSDRYLQHVVIFTFYQALLSTLLSVIPAIAIAQALNRRHFPGRNLLLRLSTMTFILPTLVTVFGLLTIYGRHGWLAQLFNWFGLTYDFSIYGLSGILLAHVFYNLPLAVRLLLQSLQTIPVEQRQLSAQLGFNYWQHLRLVEWPTLKRQILPASALIFTLCFSSFAIVIALGGGPKSTTIELAIFQSIRDFELPQAALLALLQLACCLIVIVCSQKLNKTFNIGSTYALHWQKHNRSWSLTCIDSLLIIAMLILLISPLIAVLSEAVRYFSFTQFTDSGLWLACLTSIKIALLASLLAVSLSMMLLWSSRELNRLNHRFWANSLQLSGMIILAMPGMVIATGFFLLLNNTIGIPDSAEYLVIITNALLAIPLVLKILENPVNDLTLRYHPLLVSLGIRGWNRLRWIELKALAKPLGLAMGFAAILSIGDFGIIALFGNSDFSTLPFYLYQQIGSYRNNDAAVTAGLLLIICFILFTIIEQLANRYDQH